MKVAVAGGADGSSSLLSQVLGARGALAPACSSSSRHAAAAAGAATAAASTVATSAGAGSRAGDCARGDRAEPGGEAAWGGSGGGACVCAEAKGEGTRCPRTRGAAGGQPPCADCRLARFSPAGAARGAGAAGAVGASLEWSAGMPLLSGRCRPA